MNTAKKWLLSITAIAALSALAVALAQNEPMPQRAAQAGLGSVRQQISALQARVDRIEERLRKLEAAKQPAEPWRQMPGPPHPTPLQAPGTNQPSLMR